MLILVGPSASGKTQAVEVLRNNYHYQKLVTYTSRKKRVGEVDNVDYHFITKDAFISLIHEHFFIEYVNYNNNYYGTSFSEINDNKVVILEPSGIKHYLSTLRDQVVVIYLDCSKELRKQRMMLRGDSLEQIEKRLLLDDEVFNEDIKKLADYVIDTSNISLDDVVKSIDKIYKGV